MEFKPEIDIEKEKLWLSKKEIEKLEISPTELSTIRVIAEKIVVTDGELTLEFPSSDFPLGNFKTIILQIGDKRYIYQLKEVIK